jgi:GH24 family phage-related lysozyme (muramidase)
MLIALFALTIGMGSVMGEDRFKRLRNREGLRLNTYKDSLGKNTIGIGHLITDEEEESGLIYGIPFKKGITEKQAEEIKNKDIEKHDKETDASLKKYGLDKTLNEFQKIAVKDASFQLGSNWLDEHKKTRKLLQEGKFKEAGEEAKNSVWYKQTPKRVDDFQRNINRKTEAIEESMINKPLEEEEEEKKPSVDELRQKFNARAVENTPAGQQLSEVQKRAVAKETLNPENQTNGATESQKKKSTGEQVSAKDSFMEAITYFLPSIAGMAIGGAIAGEEGAASGAKLGMKAGESYYQAKERAQERALKYGQGSPEQERLKLSRENLEMRKKELQAQIDRSKSLAQERGDRRYERYDERANKLKDSFMNRNDIKAFREQEEGLIALEEMVTTGKKIPGGSLALVSKGLSGETGVLTDRDIQRAQINPDIWNKVKRGYYTTFKGEISPDDAKEILKTAKLKSKALKGRIKNKVGNFAKSRSKTLSKEHGEILGLDLNLELGLEDFDDKVKEPSAVKKRIEGMSPEEKRKRLMMLKKKYNR